MYNGIKLTNNHIRLYQSLRVDSMAVLPFAVKLSHTTAIKQPVPSLPLQLSIATIYTDSIAAIYI
jgi:hypothetical protein